MQQSLIDDTCHFLCLWLLMLARPVGPLSREVISIQMGRGVSRIVEDCFDHLYLTVSGLPIPSSVNKLKKEAGGAKEAPTQEHAIDSTDTHFILHFIRFLHTLSSSSMLHETCRKDVADGH